MKDMPALHVETHGHITDEEVASIRRLFEECYNRLQPERLELVEIEIFENDGLWRSHVASERKRAAVASAEFDDAFISIHDAWTGVPRISISLERRETVIPLVWEGALHHEAGHSILHGALEYYVFPTPRALMNAANEFPTLAAHLTDLLYLLALAVKDMEVTRLLFASGYVEDQAAYARFVMRPSDQDQQMWYLAHLAAEARVLYLTGRLKDIAAAAVLASGSERSHLKLDEVEESLNYLPQESSKAMLRTTDEVLRALSKDTFLNVMTAANVLVARIIEPEMKRLA